MARSNTNWTLDLSGSRAGALFGGAPSRGALSSLVLCALVGCSSADETSSPNGASAPNDTSTASGGSNSSTNGATTDSAGEADGGTGNSTGGTAGGSNSTGGQSATGGSPPTGTSGCAQSAPHASGGVNIDLFVDAASEDREFYLSLPENYDPNEPHALIFGYPGTSWTGEQIQPYLAMESDAVSTRDDEIFVYPTPLWRFFDGSTGGFALGPHGGQFGGMEDIQFTEAVFAYMSETYCIDKDRVFATGHSWGGDIANVVSCFTDIFRATAPIAANEPYWFHDEDTPISCSTNTVVWNFYGLGDDWFNDGGDNGRDVRDFWMSDRGCDGGARDLGISGEECEEYSGCRVPVRSCLYGASFGHQAPDYFAAEAMAFFRSFP